MNKIKTLFFGDLNQVEKFGFPIVLLLVVYGFFLASINQHYYDNVYTIRNGFICSLQQLLLFLLMVQSFYRSFQFGFKEKKALILLTFLFFGFLFLFGFGEKIRWGQFVFELSLPAFFKQYNAQDQITIHNLRFGDFNVNKVIFGSFLAIVVVSYTLVMTWLYTKYEAIKNLVDKFAIPVPRTSQILWYVILVAIALSIPVPKRGEVVQFAGVWSFMMFFSFPRNAYLFKKED